LVLLGFDVVLDQDPPGDIVVKSPTVL
jgi:hypothetical protein